jgi:hypothetical protein
MATTTNYGWTTPDDTALVKDGAAAIRTLGTSVDTTTKALNPSTTLGDIEYRSATANTNTRLPIGSTGNVLTVSGGVPAWSAPSSSVANYSLLNTGGTALTGASTITVSGISGMGKLMILIHGASMASASGTVRVRLNADSGSNYGGIGNQVELLTSYNVAFWGSTNALTDASFLVGAMGPAAGDTVNAEILLDGCNSAGNKIYRFSGGGGTGSASAGAGPTWRWGGGRYTGTSTISSISLVGATNFDAGTVYVFGSAV